jgi:uncharacterized cupin superfamily protein
MKAVNVRDIPEEEQRSPAGRYHSYFRNLSLALGGVRNAGPWGGGHPFDLQIRRLPPGKSVCPYHSHFAQWELFVVRAGQGTVRTSDGHHAVHSDDVFLHPPGHAHQLLNTGNTDLEVLIVTDNPVLDGCHYPDSDKWALRPPGRVFRLTDAHYYDGEEELPPGVTRREPFAIKPAPTLAAPSPFAQRRVNLADLAWENWSSPKGRFRSSGQQVSVALGAKHRAPLTAGGHPFDLECGKVPPGATVCPYHLHALQWECYLFLGGRGEFRLADERFAVGADDLVLAPPGVAHTFTNTGAEDLRYLLVADDPPADYGYYPDSGKWGMSQPRQFFRQTAVDYFDGEE